MCRVLLRTLSAARQRMHLRKISQGYGNVTALEYDRCRKWLKVVGDTDLPYLPPAKLNEIRYVCGCHFTNDQFTNSTRKRLKKTAVPSLIDARIVPCIDDLVNQYPLPLDISRAPAVAVEEFIHVTYEHATNTTTNKTSPAIETKARHILPNTAHFVEPIAEEIVPVMETEMESVPEIVSAVSLAPSRPDTKIAADGGACGLKRYRKSEQFLSQSEYRYKRIGNYVPPISTPASVVVTLDNSKVSYVAKSLNAERMGGLSLVRDENCCVNRTTFYKLPRGTKGRSKEHIIGNSRRTSYSTTTSPSEKFVLQLADGVTSIMAGTDTEPMSRLLKIANKFNCFYLSGFHAGDCRAFVVEGQQVGLVRPDVMKELLNHPQVFQVHPEYVQLNPAFRGYGERSARVDEVLREWRAGGKFITLRGWREECYEVRAQFNTPPLFKMDRSATCLFGIRKYGVDINGYVMDPIKGLSIWLQKRSPNKQTWPGYWDNMVSGGLSVGFGIHETAIKEAGEEGSIPQNLLGKLKSAGCVSFFFESERGLFPNTEFVYDLELPPDFVPSNSDGEVEEFELLPVSECLERVLSPHFKTTSIPVSLDFLIRHGYITAENEPNFIQIMELLHVPLQTMYSHIREQTKHKISANGETNEAL